MSRINTNVVSLTAQRNLAIANKSVNQSLERLSTGLRINRGSDDPAGLIASERMRSEKVALKSAISNSVRATNLIATAEASLNEISGLLLDVQGLVDTAANSGGMTTEEIAANQLLVDEAIDSITRIASTAQFNGKKLLDGSLGGYTSTLGAPMESVQITSVNMGGSSTRDVYVQVDGATTQAATKATLFLDADHDAGADANNVALAAGRVNIIGNLGTAQIDLGVAASLTSAQIAQAINDVSDETGVTASSAAAGITLSSAEFGSSQFIGITLEAGAVFTTHATNEGAAASMDNGTDIAITGVGAAAGSTDTSGVTVDGLTVTINRADLQATVTLLDAQAALDSDTAFTVTSGGGAKFQIGAEINTSNQITVAIENVAATNLGTTALLSTLKTGGVNSLDKSDLSTAATVVTEAISTISSLRGRLGAVQKNTLETQIRSLGSTLENITSAESIIRDTDFAEETAAMTRSQILVQAGTSVLAMANSAPQNVLALLQ